MRVLVVWRPATRRYACRKGTDHCRCQYPKATQQEDAAVLEQLESEFQDVHRCSFPLADHVIQTTLLFSSSRVTLLKYRQASAGTAVVAAKHQYRRSASVSAFHHAMPASSHGVGAKSVHGSSWLLVCVMLPPFLLRPVHDRQRVYPFECRIVGHQRCPYALRVRGDHHVQRR